MNAQLLAAIDAAWDAAKAAPSKRHYARVVIGPLTLKVGVVAERDNGQFGGEVTITVTNRTVA
jgi:hypothetical protein